MDQLLSTLPIISAWLATPVFFIFNACSILLASFWRKPVEKKIVWITGASSGIGEALAKELYVHGAQLVLSSRRLSELERVKRDLILLPARSPSDPMILPMDLSDHKSFPSKVKEVLIKFGRVDVLVNNAGILSRAEVLECGMDVFRQVMEVNYFGLVALTKAVLPSMVERRQGQILAISSVQGRVAIPRRSAYAASKHAVVGFMDSLRGEIANTGVTVTCAHPGYVKTNISHASLLASGQKYGKPDENIESGYDVDYVAKQIFSAIQDRSSELVVAPFQPTFLIYLRTLCPPIHFFIMKTISKSEKYY